MKELYLFDLGEGIKIVAPSLEAAKAAIEKASIEAVDKLAQYIGGKASLGVQGKRIYRMTTACRVQ